MNLPPRPGTRRWGRTKSTYGDVYLLFHGGAKLVLVVKDKLWAYLMLIILLVVFIVFQIYRLSYGPRLG